MGEGLGKAGEAEVNRSVEKGLPIKSQWRGALGELSMGHRKWNTPLLIAFIAAAAQILAAIIHRL